MELSDLPNELESEILSRVPTTCLSKLRPTCKRWYALFKDPSFLKKNLGKAAPHVILKKDLKVYSGIINIHGTGNNFDPSIEFRGKKDSEHVKIFDISLCHGLLLCTTMDHRIVIWNPCTGQTRWIQHSREGYYQKYYLGYENNNGNYKILSCSISKKGGLMVLVIEIYEFNSDSWRVLDDVTDCDQWCLLPGGVSLKGNTYWFNESRINHPVNTLLMFDFTRERVEHLSLPFQISSRDDNVVLSCVREEKLGLLRRRFDSDSDSLKIWVADTKIDEETKHLSWSNFSLVNFSKSLIADMRLVISFLLDEEKKMVVFFDTSINDESKESIRIYIEGENMHKQVYNEIINESVYDRLLLSYVPSLVQIQQATGG